jgi:hypothetical protein
MATSTYEVRQRGIKAFPEGNRIDFILEDPEAEPVRCSIFFDNMEKDVKLGGSKLTILPPDREEDGSLSNPNRLSIRWGRRIVNLGLCQKDGIKPYFYRGLETENDRARPKTTEDLFAAMGWGKGE